MLKSAFVIDVTVRRGTSKGLHLRCHGPSMRRDRSQYARFWMACVLALPCALIALPIERLAAATEAPAPQIQGRPFPPPTVKPMRSTYYARRDGATVQGSLAISAPVIRTLKENEAVSVIGKLVIQNADQTQRIWYKLKLGDGTGGFGAEDQIFSHRGLKEKQHLLQWIAQLDVALNKVRSQGRGRYRALSGLWSGRCKFYYEGNLLDSRKLPRPNGGNAVNDSTIAVFSSLVQFVYFDDMKVHVATGEKPAEFRTGRLQYVKDVGGHALYRARMDDGGDGFVLTLDGPRFSLDSESALAKGPLKLQPACTRAGADVVIGKLKRLLRRRIDLILAE